MHTSFTMYLAFLQRLLSGFNLTKTSSLISNLSPTLALVNAQDEITLCNKVCAQREAFYRSIVANNPSQAKYLNGWLRRVHEMQVFVTSPTNLFE